MKKYIALFLFSAILVGAGCSKDEDSSEIKAGFTFQITENPGEVVFTNKSSNAQSFELSFGDGKGTTVKNPVHVYDFNETYIVKLVAFGTEKTASVTDTLVITNVLEK
jgi:PKD repeat protein